MKVVRIMLIGLVISLSSCDEPAVGEEPAVAVAAKEKVELSPEELIDREVESLRVKSGVLDQEVLKYDAALAEERRLRSELEKVDLRIMEAEDGIEQILKAEKMAKELNAGLAQVIERAGLEPRYKTSDEFNRTYVFVNTLERELRRLKKENEELREELGEGE